MLQISSIFLIFFIQKLNSGEWLFYFCRMTLEFIIHYGLHFIVPFLIGYLFYKKKWLQVSLILIATMLVDLDHLLANPIFDPNRCSIGFHPLHSNWAIAIYSIGLIPSKSRIVAIGLLLHMFADYLDCWL